MSPMFHSAEKVAHNRLDLYELVAHHPDATFFVRYEGIDLDEYGIFKDDVLVIDRSRLPQTNSLIVGEKDGEFCVMEYRAEYELSVWGVISYIIHKCY